MSGLLSAFATLAAIFLIVFVVQGVAGDRVCHDIGMHYQWDHFDGICNELRLPQVKP